MRRPATAAHSTGDAAPDVVAVNVTLLAALGGIGSNANFLEIDSSNKDGSVSNGVLDAQALNQIRITETAGDLRLNLVDSDTRRCLAGDAGRLDRRRPRRRRPDRTRR